MENNYDGQQIPVPNATVILVLGILSIVGCCCYGLPGLICGIIAIVMANNATKLYNAEPERYLQSSLSNVNAGKICAIIGLILSVLSILSMIWYVMYFGLENITNPELMQERMQELMGQ